MRIIVSAGGTGGHIYPALAIIEKIKQEEKNPEILYIGTTYRMEKDIIPKHGIKYVGLNVKGLNRKNIFENFLVVYLFIKAIIKSKKIIKEFNPDIVIGVGGFVTAPVIYAAHRLKIKTLIHEQNSEYGMTNKFLSRYADVVATSFPKMEIKNKKVVYTGNPVGDSSFDIKFNKKELGLSSKKKLVTIVMGSLGSDVTSDKMKDILPEFNNKDYEVLFITGTEYYDKFKKMKLSKNIFVLPYIDNMRKIFKNVDVLVTRGGASTMSEILAYNVPSIIVPSPFVTHNHQYKNAMTLVSKNAALLLEEKDFNGENLINKIEPLINDKEVVSRIKKNLSRLYLPNSALKIYHLIKELVSE
jgi:UDP-N-acetylglucosamine--N-acetylmuramyl-(pentapeptide) pyrophosphoryl-undecaprenol N-acetylglucosamine transferase